MFVWKRKECDMKISEMMEKTYDVIIKTMKQAYNEVLHDPAYITRVVINPETEEIDIQYFIDVNSWVQGWYTIYAFDYRNEDPIKIAEDNWSGEIFWDEFYPMLDEDGRRLCEEYLNDGNNYSELLDFIKWRFEDIYEIYKEKLIKEIVDSTEEDYFTDILNYVIRDAQEYEDADWED